MLKWVAAAVAAVLLLVIAAAVAIPLVVDTPRVQSLISHSVAQALGRPVRFASLSVSLFPLPAVELRDLRIAEDPRFGTQPFLMMNTGSFRLRVWPLLSGRVEFSELILERPHVALIRDRAGRLNIGTLGTPAATPGGGHPALSRGGPAAGAVPVVWQVRVVDGLVTYTSRASTEPASYRLAGLNLTLQGGGPGSPLQFRGEARLLPGDLRLRIVDGTVAVAGSRSLADAPLAARVAFEGTSVTGIAGLAIGPSPQVAGPVRGTLAVSGPVGAPTVAGDLEFARLTLTHVRAACLAPRRRTLALDAVRLPVSLASDVLTSQPLTARLGSGTVMTGVTLTLADGARLRLHGLTIHGLPLGPVLVDYLCQGYAVTGPLDLTGELSARPAALLATLAGSGRVRIGPGKVVGPQALRLLAGVLRVEGTVASLLSAELPASLFASPLDFDSIAGSYTIRNGVVATNDLRYSSRVMQISATGRYGLVDGRMDVDLVLKAGRAEIAAKVAGTSASPSVRVNPAALLPGRGVERGARELEQGVRDLLKRLR